MHAKLQASVAQRRRRNNTNIPIPPNNAAVGSGITVTSSLTRACGPLVTSVQGFNELLR
jgi:hypothetical protein